MAQHRNPMPAPRGDRIPSPGTRQITILGNGDTNMVFVYAFLQLSARQYARIRSQVKHLVCQHLDASRKFDDQERWGYFRREVLLTNYLKHVFFQYEDAWALEVFVRRLWYRPGRLQAEQELFRARTTPNREASRTEPSASNTRRFDYQNVEHLPRLSAMAPALAALLASITPPLTHLLPTMIIGGLDSDHHFELFIRARQANRREFLSTVLRGAVANPRERIIVREAFDELAAKVRTQARK